MKSFNPHDFSRRRFLGACCATVGATGLLSALSQLRLIGALAETGSPSAITGPSDYRALVCLFLAGGNDANNVVVPFDPSSYGAYAKGRGALALPREKLLELSAGDGGRSYGLHPAMPELRDLFGNGRAAILANVGTLVVPTTKDQFLKKSVPLPNALFSHNDQQVQWQSSLPDQKLFTSGWGGRLADLTNAFNENNRISMSITLAGQNSFQVGRTVAQYAVSPGGAVLPNASAGKVGALRAEAREKILAAASDESLFETAFAGLTREAVADSSMLMSVLEKEPSLKTEFPDSGLGKQLRMIARLCSVAPALGLRRQIFFARVGGWDLHDHQVATSDTSTGAHAKLLADLSQSVAAFYRATQELGIADRVTTFTASDFGRTWTTNGDGSDHGWGSHHFIVGGAVKGGSLYGKMPDFALNGPDDTGRGRWIPSTSVDEYNATLATWFGVGSSDLPTVLPNIGRFAKPNLGFLG